MTRHARNQKRRRKLLTKLQKARALAHSEEVERQPTWGRRFRAVCRLRALRNKNT